MSLLNVIQLEPDDGVEVGRLETEICGFGVGVGVVIWLGIVGIGVGDGRIITLWLNESLAMEFDDEERVTLSLPHAANKTINERHNKPQQIFFTGNALSWFHASSLLNAR